MAEQKSIKDEDFRRMQLLQLDMLVELDRVCTENNINYQIAAGTMLGAVRHKGFIPWDDDIDIFMLREEYEKLKKCIDQFDSNICFFQDHDTDREYRWGYGKLRKTGTKYIRIGQEHIKCKTGVFIDIFPLDDAPISIIGQMFQDFHCFILRKIMWSEVGKYNSKGINRIILKFLSKIPVEYAFHQINNYAQKSKNSNPNRVRILCYKTVGKLNYKHNIKERYAMPKEWYLHSKKYGFEGKEFWGIEDYNSYLKYTYGNYMQIPPEEKRIQHCPVSDYQF